MNFSKIKITGGPLVPVSETDIETTAQTLGVTFPRGYREYMTTLGEGRLEDVIEVYPPWRILAERENWLAFLRQFWERDSSAAVMTDEQAEESILLVEADADDVIFHPSRPNRLVVLPGDENTIIEIGTNLFEAVAWLGRKHLYTKAFRPRSFTPDDSRLSTFKPWTKPPRPSPAPAVPAALLVEATPDEFLRLFFRTLETWEMAMVKGKQKHSLTYELTGDIQPLLDFYNQAKDDLYATAYPFITDNFDLGEPVVLRSPPSYGRNGPRLVEVQLFDEAAEVLTLGDNRWSVLTPKRLFRLVRHGLSWRLDGLWEITKTGRRKRIKLFL